MIDGPSSSFTWIQAVGKLRSEFEEDIGRGISFLRDALRRQPARGFEIELVGRLLANVAAGDVASDSVYRVAVVSTYTTEPIANALRVALAREGLLGLIYEAPFGSHVQEILNPASALYEFRPDAILIAAATDLSVNGAASSDNPEEEIAQAVVSWSKLWQTIADRVDVPIFQHTMESPVEEMSGIAERRAGWSQLSAVAKLNDQLIAAAPAAVRWIDVDRLASRVGRQNWRDPRLWYHGRFAFSSKFLPEYSRLLGAALREVLGRRKKGLILDLDNTLWGGVIGDDRIDGIRLGPDTPEGAAYEAFGLYAKALGRRGVILGICSKNDMSSVEEVFEKHPHMPLKLSDFSAVACNWDDKATNIANIARELNVDVSSLVFADDNPAECELVRQALSEVEVVLLDGDPASFIRTIDELHLFDLQQFSREDLGRGNSYRARSESLRLGRQPPDIDSYLQSLEMRADLRFAVAADLTRLAQMELKTNQFNLSTRRRSFRELEEMSRDEGKIVVIATLSDRFTDHGLVSYMAAEVDGGTLYITDWVMSCRVFSRTLEEFMFNGIVELAASRGLGRIEATLMPTPKNGVIRDLFARLGFSRIGDVPEGPWRFEIDARVGPLRCFVAGPSLLPEPHEASA